MVYKYQVGLKVREVILLCALKLLEKMKKPIQPTYPPQGKNISLLTDFGFKKMFGTEANKDLLIDFLNLLLPTKHQIEDLQYLDKEQVGENAEERKAIYDLHCMSKNGEYFIVELQRSKQEFFKDRSIYYSSSIIRSQGEKGKGWDFKLPPVYTIAILDFVFVETKDQKEYIHKVQLRREDGSVFYDKLNYIYIELPKFNKKQDELETHFEKWLFAFKWLHKLKNRPLALQERVFKRLFELAEIAKYNDMERAQYDNSWKTYWDNENTLAYAKKEGREETILEMIKNGLDNGHPLKIISEYTNLPVEKIQQIITEQGWGTGIN